MESDSAFSTLLYDTYSLRACGRWDESSQLHDRRRYWPRSTKEKELKSTWCSLLSTMPWTLQTTHWVLRSVELGRKLSLIKRIFRSTKHDFQNLDTLSSIDQIRFWSWYFLTTSAWNLGRAATEMKSIRHSALYLSANVVQHESNRYLVVHSKHRNASVTIYRLTYVVDCCTRHYLIDRALLPNKLKYISSDWCSDRYGWNIFRLNLQLHQLWNRGQHAFVKMLQGFWSIT